MAQPVSDGAGEASLAHLPLTLFAAPMGLGGLALAWRAAAQAGLAPPVIGEAAAALASAVFVLVLSLFAAKAVLHPAALSAEWSHPMRGVFAAAGTIAAMLAGILVMPWWHEAGAALWAGAALAHIAVAVALLRRWILQPVEVAHAAPSWMIPLVGNIFAPLGALPAGFPELGWLLFGIGAGLWLFVTPLVLNRLIFHPGLPPRLVPSLAILLAPPAVAFLAWVALAGGALDATGRVLFGLSLFFAASVLAMLPLFLALPFFVSWWVFTFPAAAFATASIRYAALVGGWAATSLAVAALAAATFIVALVAAATLRHAGTLIRPES